MKPHLHGDFKQVVDPKQVNRFWEWLFENQDRVGEVKDYYSIPDISFLLLFLGKTVVWANEKFTIESITPVKGGVRINLKDKNGAIMEVMNKKRSKVLDNVVFTPLKYFFKSFFAIDMVSPY